MNSDRRASIITQTRGAPMTVLYGARVIRAASWFTAGVLSLWWVLR